MGESDTDRKVGVDEVSSEDGVRREFEKMREVAKEYSAEDFKSGNWFFRFLKYVMATYAEKVDARYFREKYPGLNADAIVERRISAAKKASAIEGFVSSSAYSGLVAATIGSKGGASPWTVPAAAASLGADLLYTTKVQLELAYDLAILYDKPIDLEDPEDLLDLVTVAFGVKTAEVVRESAMKIAPEATRQAIKKVVSGSSLDWLKKNLPLIGNKLAQRHVIKFAIPVVAVPLSTGLNYWSTGKVAATARQIYRDKAASEEFAKRFVEGAEENYLLALKIAYAVAIADGKQAAEETWLLHAITSELTDAVQTSAVEDFSKIIDLDVDATLVELELASPDVQKFALEVAYRTAAVDHKIHRKEKAILKKIAAVVGEEVDWQKVKDLATPS